jgi:hypothetical protein
VARRRTIQVPVWTLLNTSVFADRGFVKAFQLLNNASGSGFFVLFETREQAAEMVRTLNTTEVTPLLITNNDVLRDCLCTFEADGGLRVIINPRHHEDGLWTIPVREFLETLGEPE